MSAGTPPPAALPGDQARVSVHVRVEPAVAFAIFTEETDLWWRRGPRFRVAGGRPGTISFERRVGGRLFESFDTSSGTHVHEAGRIAVWEPPSRFVFSWRNANFAPDEATEVEVVFEPSGDGTVVTVSHRGWAGIRPDHPARHGQEGAAFIRSMGLWWGDQLTSLRERIDRDMRTL